MATYVFRLNRRKLREKIGRKLGIMGAGNSLKPEDSSVLNEAIDIKLKEFHSKHVLWFSTSGAVTPVTLTSDAATVTVAASDFLFAVTARIVVNSREQPLQIIDHTSYQEICDKTRTGVPEQVFFNGTTAYFYPVPNDAYVMRITYQGVAADSTDVDPLDMATGAMGAFASIVALDLADEFDVDEAKIGRWRADQGGWEATIFAVAAQRTDRPDSTAEYF
jgi:hypothetical protein